MPRRVSLPGASELFRATSGGVEVGPEKPREAATPRQDPKPAAKPRTQNQAESQKKPAPTAAERRAASGRVRHDEKITVYVSRDELIALEQARLMMRADFGLGVDRGRIVRESIALAMAQLETLGAEAPLVQRLREA
ncbi:hypothetical protein EDD41_3154 [Luteococcus japonicus]|uniref:Cobyrinic acid a,c-diamide synthase n=1 Tax=Luteococcus japonicus TaxID=33984 RepID=A0A3N1ZYF6_9ACTN|nr:hypothetical protein [Luteococcus japonicus]ROR55866.1 hypothetical protein EDD41_3154 [Luteococcus japonicus]